MPKTQGAQLAVIQNDIGYIKEQVKEVNDKVSQHYVTREEFSAVKKIAYGTVALLATIMAGLTIWALTYILGGGHK